MNPETLLSLAAVMVGNGDISLRDDPLTYAWRTLHPDDAPNQDDIDAAAVHVSAVLGVPHSPDGWWLQLAGRDSLHIAALLAKAADHAKPKEIEP